MDIIEHPQNADYQITDAKRGEVELTPHRKRVAIMGGMPLRMALPYDDPDLEVWSCNLVLIQDRQGRLRADRWFELHPMSVQSKNDMQWIRDNPRPLYTLDHEPDFPNSLRFPIERVESLGHQDYFSCTFAYQIALAIVEGFEEIGLYGVDLVYGTDRERESELPCVAYWLGVFEGRGGRVVLPPESSLLYHAHRYGYDYWDEKRWVERRVRNINQERIDHLERVLGPEQAKQMMEEPT